ncbi:MAG TPA: GNAT family N-acetyltransferase [Mycobacteriales bacterium]|jgi:RimJ/RimL family protein N-acetyltransferase|nr:GNAT family N-acetyltransferase [Mycobacteriales bacterium]
MSTAVEPVEISAGAIHLRPFRPADADEVSRICQDPAIARWTTVPSPYTAEHGREFVAKVAAGWANGTQAVWAACDAGTGALLASIGLHLDRGGPGTAELGYWSAPEARGRGVVTSAARAACRWGFTALGLRRIDWYAQVGNEASWRVAHQIGFRYEGRLRSRVMSAGTGADAWGAGLLAGEVAEARVPLAFGADPHLTDGPVTVRRWGEQDVSAYQALHNDPSNLRWGGGRAGRPLEAGAAWEKVCVEAVEGWLTGTHALLAICSDGVPSGDLSVRRIHERLAVVGWSLRPEARGRGHATRAVRLMTEWAHSVGFARLEARVHAENLASQALAERAGFRREGLLCQDSPDGGGWGDGLLYGWTKP